MKYEVAPQGLRADGSLLGAALREFENVEVASCLGPLSSAFPGGVTAASIREVGAAWGDRLLRARRGLAQVADGLSTAGERYEVVEQVARRALAHEGGT